MPTPFDDLNVATKAIMAVVDAIAPTDVTQAPTNYGLDFRIPSGNAMYQIQIAPKDDFRNSNVSYPRAEISIAIHHYVSSLANEESFVFDTMFRVSQSLLDAATWIAEAGIFNLEPETEPEISDGAREGNVITFEMVASVLMDAA